MVTAERKGPLASCAAMHRKLAVFVAALALVAGACSGGGDKEVKTTSKRTTTTSETDHSPSSLVEGTETTVAGSSKTTLKGATATTAKGKGSGGSGTTSPGASPTPTADPNAAPGPAKTGTYGYAQSGQVGGNAVNPSGSLTVSGGGPSQTFHRDFGGDGGSTDILFTFGDNGPHITRVVVHQGAFTIGCTFNAPVPAPPWPATAGRGFSGHSTCDNGFAADFSGTVGGHDPDTVNGQSVDTIVINSTLHITGTVFNQPIDITVKDTQHWAPSLRVPTYSHETISGTISGDITSTLTSTP